MKIYNTTSQAAAAAAQLTLCAWQANNAPHLHTTAQTLQYICYKSFLYKNAISKSTSEFVAT